MAFSSDPCPTPHDERIDPEELTPVLSRVPLPGAEMPADSPVTGRLGNGTTITSGLLLRPVRAHSSKPPAPALGPSVRNPTPQPGARGGLSGDPTGFLPVCPLAQTRQQPEIPPRGATRIACQNVTLFPADNSATDWRAHISDPRRLSIMSATENVTQITAAPDGGILPESCHTGCTYGADKITRNRNYHRYRQRLALFTDCKQRGLTPAVSC